MQEEYKGSPIQIPVTKGIAKSTNHKGNVNDVLRQTYNKPVSIADIGINSERSAKIHSAVTELSPNISEKDDRRKKLEAQVAALRASECASKAIVMVQERRKAELTLQKEMTRSGHLTQIIDTFPEKSCSIWDEIDLLEGSPAHRSYLYIFFRAGPSTTHSLQRYKTLVLSISFSSCSVRCNLCINFLCRTFFTFLYFGPFTPLCFSHSPFFK